MLIPQKRLKHLLYSLIIGTALWVSCLQDNTSQPEVLSQLPQKIDFNFHVKPILSDRCYTCHGPDEKARKAALRLDTEAGIFAPLSENKDAYIVVPHNLGKSNLYQRISSDDPEYLMPPPTSNLRLTSYEKAVLAKWIEQGAEWKKHWSFSAPQESNIPDIADASWAKNEIDQFILKKLEKENLSPSGEADKATLLRRISFDLTGLPPSIEELDDFLADKSEHAYEKQVDRLLSSPAYGERMAADWMDVARYADTHGYLDDTHREVWHWRDWVIQAFNENLPYDKFITWQTAGDLLPHATQEQKLATCFQRLHRQNQEGGVLPEEYRIEYVADRVQTTAKAFLGITMECARCHDHKYDPISQKNFYQMAAFFNNTFETGRAPIGYESGPTMLLTDAETEAQIQHIRKAIKAQENRLLDKEPEYQTAFEKWLEKDRKTVSTKSIIRKDLLADFSFERIDEDRFRNKQNTNHRASLIGGKVKDAWVSGIKGKGLKFDEKNALLLGKDIAQFERTDAFSISLAVFPDKAYEDASIFDNCDHKWHAYRGYELRIKEGRLLFRISHNYPQNALQIEALQALPIQAWSQISVSYDGSSKAEGMKIYVEGRLIETKIVHNNLYKSILRDEKNPLVVMPYMGFKLGWRMNDPSLVGGKIDELKIHKRELSALEIAHIHGTLDLENILQKDKLKAQEQKGLWDLYTLHGYPTKDPVKKELKALQEQENRLVTNIPEAMVLGDQPTLRPTFVLNRGDYQEPLEEVQVGTPGSILDFPDEAPKNRLGLAQWLVDAKNPLTARVAVNRLWQICFGQGLVRSPDDFGSQGALPTHPFLLDYLAVEFRTSGWDVKAMLKRILLSATYRQHSHISPALVEKDPDNKLLARAPRYRLPAEMLRDQALAVSGLLYKKPGGKSIKPYQPEGLWSEIAFQAWAHYKVDTGNLLYKRSLYIYWKRNTPHPFMTTFDIPDRATCSVKRLRTSTPMQALMMLNYPQFPEASRAFSEKILTVGGASLEEQLSYAFRTLISHAPSQEEIEAMRQLYTQEFLRFTENPEAARAFLEVGAYPINPTLNPIELASFASVSLALMNTSKSNFKQ